MAKQIKSQPEQGNAWQCPDCGKVLTLPFGKVPDTACYDCRFGYNATQYTGAIEVFVGILVCFAHGPIGSFIAGIGICNCFLGAVEKLIRHGSLRGGGFVE